MTEKQRIRALAKHIAQSETPYLLREIESIPPYTFVKLSFRNTLLVGVGFAKCNPIDEFSSIRGLTIAEGRASLLLARILTGKQMDFASAIEYSKACSEREA